MDKKDIVPFLAEQNPADILCLGARTGAMADTLNTLEKDYFDKFNKYTVYATISDNDSIANTKPEKDSAIFTTFDSIINIKHTDGLIDLSPCIGIYQEAVFFDNYKIDAEIELRLF